ncbi:MAG TPA: FxLD family lanthipeptide [Actinoplanes sp.]|jgi:FxLD family lantipeptide
MNFREPQSAPMAAAPVTDDLELDVRVVTAGPVTAALLSSTDDGCDTVKGSDC